MTKRSRRVHLPDFKAAVAVAALEGRESVKQLAERFRIHANLVAKWRDHLRRHAALAFARPTNPTLRSELEALRLENDFLSHALGLGHDSSVSP